MKFSFILATYGRSEIIRNLLNSLDRQGYKNFEVVVVDQNDHDDILQICDEFRNLEIQYLKSDRPGLSRARNIGLENMTGNIVSFPDDDCWYPCSLLTEVQNYFEENPEIPLVSVATRNPENGELLSYTPFNEKTKITIRNIFHTITSIGLFINYSAISEFDAKQIRFNERLGLGTSFFSSEEMDFTMQFINKGTNGFYEPDLFVYHPFFKEIFDQNYFQKIKNNSRGHGAFFKKSLTLRKPDTILNVIEFVIGRPIAGLFLSLISLDFKKIRKYLLILSNRINGFIKF